MVVSWLMDLNLLRVEVRPPSSFHLGSQAALESRLRWEASDLSTKPSLWPLSSMSVWPYPKLITLSEANWFLFFKQGNGKIMPASTFDMDKLKSTLKQFVRDWSETGKAEREACYQPIIKEILKNFPKERW